MHQLNCTCPACSTGEERVVHHVSCTCPACTGGFELLQFGTAGKCAFEPFKHEQKAVRRPLPMSALRNTHQDVTSFAGRHGDPGAIGNAGNVFPATGYWLRRGRHIVLYGV